MNSYVVIVCLAVAMAAVNGQDFNECLKKDSISCVQKSLYRTAKEFFGKDSIEIVGGVNLVKNPDRSSRSGKEVLYDQEIDAADSVVDRQSTLENFIGEEASGFLTGRTLKVNFLPAMEKLGQTARAMVDSVPTEVREAATAVNDVVEGRGKKKLLKSLLPLLLAAKAKIGVIAVLLTFGIALLAKKAIVASLLSLAISAFIGLKSMWSKACGHSVTPYSNGGWNNAASGSGAVGWSAPVQSAGWSSGGWEDGQQSSYSSAQSQAYSGYH